MRYTNNVDSIITALGGDDGVVALFGCVRTTPFNWRANGCFPADTYWVIQQELRNKGATCSPRAQQELWNWRKRANGEAAE